jgi:DNA-binding transcriptional ArsR family regulator
MEDDDERLTRVFGALADPTRRAILARLRSGEATVAELADAFPISQPAVSRHLRVLGEAGLVTRTRRATARLSHLDATPMKDAADWMAQYRAYWQESHDRLDALLVELQQREDPP